MAADITAIVLTVVCAAIAGCCALLVLRLWRSARSASPAPGTAPREPAAPGPAS